LTDEQKALFSASAEKSLPRPRDLAFETLAEVTGANWTTARGELNAALALIRAEQNGATDQELAREIRVRAGMYRNVMPSMMLTPIALAKHWRRVKQETQPKHGLAPCATCDSHRLVVVGMNEHGVDVYTPCPDCHPLTR